MPNYQQADVDTTAASDDDDDADATPDPARAGTTPKPGADPVLMKTYEIIKK